MSGYDGASGGREDQGHILSQEKDSHHRGLSGGERWGQVETDLQRGVDGDEQQGHLWHVWFPWGETLQYQTLQVSNGAKGQQQGLNKATYTV